MKLSTEILLHHLEPIATVIVDGPVGKELVLERPLIYRGKEDAHKENQLFLFPDAKAASEALSSHSLGQGAVLLCLEEMQEAVGHPGEDISLVILKDCRLTLVGLYDDLQRFFQAFDRWEAALRQEMDAAVDLNALLAIGEEMLGNPMKIIDAQYRCLAYSPIFDEREDIALLRPRESYSTEQIAAVIEDRRIAHNRRGGLLFTVEGFEMQSFNLFDQKQYIGAVTVYYVNRSPEPGDEVLGLYFADFIREAMLEDRSLLSGQARVLRKAFQDALSNRPIGEEQGHYLQKASGKNDGYLCLRVLASDAASQTLSVKYLCSTFESEIPDSIALPYKTSIVVLIRIHLPFSRDHSIVTILREHLGRLQLKGALSDVFMDIRQTRHHYRQANIALDLGLAKDPDHILYLFEDYALQYLIANSTGEFSTRLFLTDGLRQLIRHDEEALAKGTVGAVSYIDTLRIYLENNMNLSRAAEELYIHKTSLLARLEKIRALLRMDLDDPDIRLRLMILLKRIEYETTE